VHFTKLVGAWWSDASCPISSPALKGFPQYPAPKYSLIVQVAKQTKTRRFTLQCGAPYERHWESVKSTELNPSQPTGVQVLKKFQRFIGPAIHYRVQMNSALWEISFKFGSSGYYKSNEIICF
jgi:hypothetical protein